MTDLHNTQDLEALYSPSTKVAEHQRGDSIQYTDGGTVQTGVILWVCAPGQVVEGRPPLGVRYIVENDNKSWPDTVFPSDIIARVEPQEACATIGTHTLSLNLSTGLLQVDATTLGAQDAYELLTWLSEYRETLHQATHKDDKE